MLIDIDRRDAQRWKTLCDIQLKTPVPVPMSGKLFAQENRSAPGIHRRC